jgi:hypothetical protein
MSESSPPDSAADHAEAFPSLPETATEACGRYARDVFDLLGFVGFVAQVATRSDEIQRIAEKALRDTAVSDKDREPSDATPGTDGAATRQLREFRHLLLQMMLSRGVDNFLTYVSQLLALVFRTRPETLRSSETVRVDEVLRHESMDELVNDLADRRVNRLAYLGMRELADDLADKLDLRLFERDEDLERAVEVIEIRNLIAHNRAVVNQTFLRRLPPSREREGDLVALEFDRVYSELRFLTERVFDIDGRAASKFALPTVKPPGTDMSGRAV